jgi:lysophospholipase L1-like esterase
VEDSGIAFIRLAGGVTLILEASWAQHAKQSLDRDVLADNPGQYLVPEDGIHLNKAGHALFAHKMFELVSSLV